MMKNELEEQMKRLTDEASLEDVMPGFDKEALWNNITDELHAEKPKQKRILLGWVSHAAAVLLAIAGTWLFIHFNQRTAPDTVVVSIPAAPPQVPVNKEPVAAVPLQPERQADDVPVVAPERQIGPDHHQRSAATAASVKESTPVMQQQPLVPVPEEPISVTPELQPVLAAAKAPRKVTHYLDLDIEDATPHIVTSPSPPALVQMKLNRPEIPNNTHQKTPLKELVVALAR